MSIFLKVGGVALVVLLAACSEKSQALGGPARKSDTAVWAANDSAKHGFAASGWKGGDQVAWEAQIRTRNQAQNDYAR